MAQSTVCRRSPSLERPSMSNTEHPVGSTSVTSKQKLNLVLCGSDETLKKSISKLIRVKKKRLRSLHHKQKGKECVKREGKIHGHQICLVNFPALCNARLSEEEVMRQTLQCVALCDPGVHVFLLIVPDALLTDEDKAEMEKIQERFSSRINQHAMVLIFKEKNVASQMNVVPPSIETSFQTFGGRRFVLESSSQVPALLQQVENMVQENDRRCYTTFMCLQAQIELERNKHMAEMEELRRSMMKTAGVTHDDLRIVLLGKTGAGKSASGNTILNELRQSEEELKKREEEIKKEADETVQKELEEKQKQNKRKRNNLEQQQNNFIKYLEEKHEKEKQKLQEMIERETREHAEREFREKLKCDV